MQTLGNRIRTALKARNIKQITLAKQIGITQASLSQFCNNIANPSLRTIRDICNALNINEEWLLHGEEPMDKETPETVADTLSKKYGLQPYVTRVVNAVAQAVKVLSEEQLKALIDKLIAETQREDNDNESNA